MTPPSPSAPSFIAIHLRVRDRERAERAAAEAYAAGAVGAEEREEAGDLRIVLYAPVPAAEAVCAAVAAVGAPPVAREPVAPMDWAEDWKREVRPVVISPRLCIRPSFRRVPARPGQHVVVVDPGQAFGTGAHESTRLALEWIDACIGASPPALDARDRLLDVGTGSGVLALAALGLAPLRAVACDLDPLAAEAARDNARANGLAGRLGVFVGGVEALAPSSRFALVVANLLRRELEPVLPALAVHLAPSGRLVLSGLLASERERVGRLAAAHGLEETGVRERRDPSGETWTSLLLRRAGRPAPLTPPPPAGKRSAGRG